jgi:hypothetical protein
MHRIAIERGQLWVRADISQRPVDVRYSSESGHPQALNNSFNERRMSSARGQQSLSCP